MNTSIAAKPQFSGGFATILEDKTRLATYMGILMPNVFVAPIRYFTMRETPEVRYRMFMRDVLAAAAGVASFYATRLAVRPVLSKTLMKAKSAENVELAATFAAWVVNVLVQGIGAVRMSEWMSKRQQAKEGMSAPTAAISTPVTPALPHPVVIPHPAMPVERAPVEPLPSRPPVQSAMFSSPSFPMTSPIPPYAPSAFPMAFPMPPNPFVSNF